MFKYSSTAVFFILTVFIFGHFSTRPRTVFISNSFAINIVDIIFFVHDGLYNEHKFKYDYIRLSQITFLSFHRWMRPIYGGVKQRALLFISNCSM